MKTKTTMILFGAGALIASAFLFFKPDHKAGIMKVIDAGGDSQQNKDRIRDIVNNQMTKEELKSTYVYLTAISLGKKDSISPELVAQIAAISAKYKIFT